MRARRRRLGTRGGEPAASRVDSRVVSRLDFRPPEDPRVIQRPTDTAIPAAPATGPTSAEATLALGGTPACEETFARDATPPAALPTLGDARVASASAGELLVPELPTQATRLASRPSAAEHPWGPWRRRLAIAQLGCIVFALYLALFNVSVVRGSSMAPGIHDGDRIVVDRFAYLLGTVARGDVVVLKYPLDPSLDYIKRVIGLPGDEIVIENGAVYVNGERLDEPYVESTDPWARLSTRVLPAHYFVLGDNRPRSSDSREFGQVPMDYVRGRVEVRLWPLARAGLVH